MRILIPLALFVGAALTPLPATAQTSAPSDARLYVIWPRDGARVRSPVTVRFGLKNMGVTHAGDPTPNLGHHHLLVDVTDPPQAGEPIPSDKRHLHFGAGQTETELELPLGKHTLQLVLGDANHVPFKPMVVSKAVTITVIRPAPARPRPRRRRGSTAFLTVHG